VKWLKTDSACLSAPYSIHSDIRGFSVWFKKKGQYGVLAREIQSLKKAQEYCEAHKAKEDFQAKQLEAVFVK
jgi:hypothetical protein